MSSSCDITLPHGVRVEDVAQLLAIYCGNKPELRKSPCLAVEVNGYQLSSCSDIGSPECCRILLNNISGDRYKVLFHFEGGMRNGKLLCPDSTPFWCAVAKKLVDFYGGIVDWSDEDEAPNYVVPWRPWDEITPDGGDEWDTFQTRMFNEKALTEDELREGWQHAAYKNI